MKRNLVIGTRGSKLALWQANFIAKKITERYSEIEVTIKRVTTTGDKILDVPLAKIGGKGLFTKEIETEMLAGDIDLAVHSLKDMPTELPKGLTFAAITERVDAGDAFISPKYRTIDNLPRGAKVGTSSLRRKAQLLNYRPDLEIADLRGNLDTRLNKLANHTFDAILLAVAGLKRLGWDEHITQVIPKEICLPAVGQGALAIEARSDDAGVLAVLEFLNDNSTRRAVEAERAFLRVVEGGCQVPVGVYGIIADDCLNLKAVILSVDGTKKVEDSISGSPSDAEQLGITLASRMLNAGGREILAELK